MENAQLRANYEILFGISEIEGKGSRPSLIFILIEIQDFMVIQDFKLPNHTNWIQYSSLYLRKTDLSDIFYGLANGK
jgi:hypothetical protein